jgi:hypothetical protein
VQQHNGRPASAFAKGLASTGELKQAQWKLQGQLRLEIGGERRSVMIDGVRHGFIRA